MHCISTVATLNFNKSLPSEHICTCWIWYCEWQYKVLNHSWWFSTSGQQICGQYLHSWMEVPVWKLPLLLLTTRLFSSVHPLPACDSPSVTALNKGAQRTEAEEMLLPDRILTSSLIITCHIFSERTNSISWIINATKQSNKRQVNTAEKVTYISEFLIYKARAQKEELFFKQNFKFWRLYSFIVPFWLSQVVIGITERNWLRKNCYTQA